MNSSKVQSMVNYQEQRTLSGGPVARGGGPSFPYGPAPIGGGAPSRGGFNRGGGDYYQPQRIRDENYPPGGGGYAPRGRGFTPRGRGGYATSPMDQQQQRFGSKKFKYYLIFIFLRIFYFSSRSFQLLSAVVSFSGC